MKVDFAAKLKNLNGDPIKMAGGDSEVATLGDVAISALFTMTENDKKLTGPQKFDLYVLATIIKAGGEIDIKAKDIVLLKDRIAATNGPLVVGRAYELLEPEIEDNHGEGN